MLPREYINVGMQMSCGRNFSYGELRDHILGMANQKAQLNRPVPTDMGSVEAQTGDTQQN